MAVAVARGMARLQYAAARLPFTLLEEWVVARYWDQDALVRAGFERCLGSLDLAAGRLLGDDAIARRGLALLRLPVDAAQVDSSTAKPPAGSAPWAAAPPADDQAVVGGEQPAAPAAAGQPPEPDPAAVDRAVLQALAEQAAGDCLDVLDRLASQLPGDLQAALLTRPAPGQPGESGQPLDLGGYYQRVSDLAGVPAGQAESRARAVIATVHQQVTGTPLEELFDRLPPGYSALLPEPPHPAEPEASPHRVQDHRVQDLGEFGTSDDGPVSGAG